MSYNDELSVTNDDRAGGDPSDRPDGRAGHELPVHDLPAGRVPRHDGWTFERQFDFLDDLGRYGNVARAAGAVGMSPASAYRLRARDPHGAFAVGWRAALALAYQHLRDLALERIENGVPTTHYYRDQLVGTKLVFSDRLLLGMLNHLRPAAGDGRPAAAQPGAPADPGDAYATALDAFAVAAETGVEPVMPAAPAAAAPDVRPSPGEGPYHDGRVAAAQDRLMRGEDPYVPRFPGRIYPPHPDVVSLDAYPDGLTAYDLAHEDPLELALVGLGRDGKTLSPA